MKMIAKRRNFFITHSPLEAEDITHCAVPHGEAPGSVWGGEVVEGGGMWVRAFIVV